MKQIWRTLKIDIFGILGEKNIGKCFLKYKLLYLDQSNSSSDLSPILILRFSIPRAYFPPSRSLSNLAYWKPSATQSHHVRHRFPYFAQPHSTKRRHNNWIYQTIWQAMPIKFIYSKSWLLKSCLSFIIRQHDQEQLYL